MTDAATEPAASDRDLLTCPLCMYSLRGLAEPRCPECGYEFEWDELLDRQRRRQLWFYEHAMTHMSHWQTRWHSLRPRKFWREIHAYSDVNPRMLERYRWASFGLAICGGLIALALLLPVATLLERQGVWWSRTGRIAYAISRQLMKGEVGLYFLAGQVVGIIGFIVAMPMYLRLLGKSIVNAKVDRNHLRRVIAYSTDAAWLVLVLQIFVNCIGFGAMALIHDRNIFFTELAVFVAITIVPIGVLTLRFYWALKRYLRFPHAAGVAGAYAVIIMLAWMFLLAMTVRIY